MPVFQEDPAQFSMSRLKSDLVTHNVTLPDANSRKDVYVGLHLKHIDRKKATDFSSDEEDQDVEEPHELEPSGVDMVNVSELTDDELKATLLKHGVRAGPIVASTRALYERRLQKLLQTDVQTQSAGNGRGGANAYSDSEDEDEEGKEEESDSEESRQDLETRHSEVCPEAEEQNRLAEGRTKYYPETVPKYDSVTVTCRRPIKGAAGRPVQYKYPDAPPASPLTLERREVEGRLVPFRIQVLMFLAMVCLLYLVYACMEENPYVPLLPLLEGLSGLLEQGPAGLTEAGEPALRDPLSGEEGGAGW